MKLMKKAFTLIELMLVIVIISVLATMVLPNFTGRAEKTRKIRAQADIANISVVLKIYELDNGNFPSTEEGINALMTKPATALNWNGPYLEKNPQDPWTNTYHYKYPGVHNSQSFDL